jgi:hypothetical protein
MPRVAKELMPIELKHLPSGKWPVGGVPGLLLNVAGASARSWLLRIQVGSKRREIGLGGFPAVTLAQARENARIMRQHARSALMSPRGKPMRRPTASAVPARHAAWRGSAGRPHGRTAIAGWPNSGERRPRRACRAECARAPRRAPARAPVAPAGRSCGAARPPFAPFWCRLGPLVPIFGAALRPPASREVVPALIARHLHLPAAEAHRIPVCDDQFRRHVNSKCKCGTSAPIARRSPAPVPSEGPRRARADRPSRMQ